MRKKSLPNEKVVKLKWKVKWSTGGEMTAYNVGWVYPDSFPLDSKFKRLTNKERKIYQEYKKLPDLLYDKVYIDDHRIIVPENKKYELIIDYPLREPYKKEIIGPKTLREVLQIVVKAYRHIYQIEKKTSKLKEESLKIRTKGKSKLLNRAPTDGKYKIYGHNLSDLVIHTIYVGQGKIYLGVDS